MTNTPSIFFNEDIKREYIAVENLRISMASALRRHSIDDRAIPCIELSVYETLLNIIEHSSRDFQDQMINVQGQFIRGAIKIDIQYHGDEFDMNRIDMPDIEEHYRQGKKRGLGIFFIRTLMDSVEYKHDERMNRTTLIKSIDLHQ